MNDNQILSPVMFHTETLGSLFVDEPGGETRWTEDLEKSCVFMSIMLKYVYC